MNTPSRLAAAAILCLLAILPGQSIRANTGGPDSFGYTYLDDSSNGPGFQWIDISTSGTRVISSGNTTSSNAPAPVGIGAPVALGHPFTFYGQTYTSLVPAIDGYISTDPTEEGLDFSRDCPLPDLPSSGGGARIYAHHLNWEIASGGGVYYQYFKQSPHPHATCGVSIFTWSNVRRAGSSAPTTSFQVLLFDSGDILFQLENTSSTHFGDTETIGIQNEGATSGLAYGCPSPIPNDSGNDAILFELEASTTSNIQNTIDNAPAGAKLNYGFVTTDGQATFGWENLNLTINKPLTFIGDNIDNPIRDTRYGIQAKNCTITISGAVVNFFDARFLGSDEVTFRVINGGHLHLCDSSIFGAGKHGIELASGTTLSLRRSEISNPAPGSDSHISGGQNVNISVFKSIISESWNHAIEINGSKVPTTQNLEIDRSSIVRNRQSGLRLANVRARITQSNLTDNLGPGIEADRSHLAISNSNITSNKNIGVICSGKAALHLDHSILAGNLSASSGDTQNVELSADTSAFTFGSNISDTAPSFLSSASDQTLTNPKLTPLAAYGERIGSPSPYATSNLLCQLPLHKSPAIDASQSFIQIDTDGTDVRGTPRLADGDNSGQAFLDIGSVEALPYVTVNTAADENNSPAGTNLSLREALLLVEPRRIVFAPSLNGQTINISATVGGQGTKLPDGAPYSFVDASMLPAGITISGNGDMTATLIGSSTYHGLTFTGARNSVARVYNGTLILTNCHLVGNSQQAATNAQSYAQSGGAIFNASTAYIVNSTFTSNLCSIDEFSASTGGAFASFPTSGPSPGEPIATNHLIRCNFVNNVADGRAGAVFISGGRKTVIDGCTISENQADAAGGLVLTASQFDSSYIDLTRTSIVRNRASNNAGALITGETVFDSIYPEEIENISMTYCTISENLGASSTDGAISTSGVNLSIDHCTIVDNLGELQAGLSLHNDSAIAMKNSIIHNNLSTFNTQLSPSNINIENGSSFTSLGHNLSGNSIAALNQPSDLTNSDPLLAPLSRTLANVPTHHPLHESPALNAASNDHFAIDARGYPGSQGIRPDIGAVESAQPIVVTTNLDQLDTPTGSTVSLREALRDARDGSRITFSPAIGANTIDLQNSASGQGSPLETGKNLIVDATMLDKGITIRGPGANLRCLTLPDGQQSVSLHGISFRDGAGSSHGSAIYKGRQTDLTLTHSAIYGCFSSNAAAAVHANGGLLTLRNVTLCNNGSTRGGSAVSARNGADVSLEHTTLFGNIITTNNFPGGAAVFLESNAKLNCNHTAFGDNLNAQTNTVRNLLRFGPAILGTPIFTVADDASAPSTSQVPALELKPLQDAGGLALTCPPEAGSPVVDSGYSVFIGSPSTDARGFDRKYGSRVDVGAYELGSFLPGTTTPPLDLDSDGMDDHWEEFHGLVLQDPTADGDGDGLSNRGEYLSQTNPNVFNSIVPTKILNFAEAPAASGFILTFTSSPGIAYEVQHSADLSENSFTPIILTNGSAQGNQTQILIEPSSYGNGEEAFFRIQRP